MDTECSVIVGLSVFTENAAVTEQAIVTQPDSRFSFSFSSTSVKCFFQSHDADGWFLSNGWTL